MATSLWLETKTDSQKWVWINVTKLNKDVKGKQS